MTKTHIGNASISTNRDENIANKRLTTLNNMKNHTQSGMLCQWSVNKPIMINIWLFHAHSEHWIF